jgi:hypothetical protein
MLTTNEPPKTVCNLVSALADVNAKDLSHFGVSLGIWFLLMEYLS